MLLALALDSLGELPTPLHPVGWMGRGLGALRWRWRASTPAGQVVEGALSWSLLAGASFAAGRMLGGRHVLLDAAVLSTLLARRGLEDAALAVHAPLAAGHLPQARRRLAWHLVSRPTAELSEGEVAGAAIESLSENLSDSVVAPLLAYQLGGLPLAALYRLANTADALWGYRTPELEYSGKWAARADDLLNLLPARLTAVCAVAAAYFGFDGPQAWRIWQRNAGHTTSPNAGHPMSAFAGALGLQLSKRGVYLLNAGEREPQAGDIQRTIRLFRWTAGLAVVLLLLGDKRA